MHQIRSRSGLGWPLFVVTSIVVFGSTTVPCHGSRCDDRAVEGERRFEALVAEIDDLSKQLSGVNVNREDAEDRRLHDRVVETLDRAVAARSPELAPAVRRLAKAIAGSEKRRVVRLALYALWVSQADVDELKTLARDFRQNPDLAFGAVIVLGYRPNGEVRELAIEILRDASPKVDDNLHVHNAAIATIAACKIDTQHREITTLAGRVVHVEKILRELWLARQIDVFASERLETASFGPINMWAISRVRELTSEDPRQITTAILTALRRVPDGAMTTRQRIDWLKYIQAVIPDAKPTMLEDEIARLGGRQ